MDTHVYFLSIIASIVLGVWLVNVVASRPGSRLGRISTGCLIWVAIVVSGFIGFYIVKAIENHGTAQFRAHLKAHLDQYSGPWLPEGTNPHPDLRVHGKILTLEKTQSGIAISPIFLRLPSNLIPDTPEEVQFLVELECEWEVVGHYTVGNQSRGGAEQHHCLVNVIDKTAREILVSKYAYGSSPPPSTTAQGARGGTADDAIVNYLIWLSVPVSERWDLKTIY